MQHRTSHVYRALHDPVADAQSILPSHRIVIVEGLYVLVPRPPWCLLRPLYSLAVYLHVDKDVSKMFASRRKAKGNNISRGFTCVRMHPCTHTGSVAEAEAHYDRADAPNYDIIQSSRDTADITLQFGDQHSVTWVGNTCA